MLTERDIVARVQHVTVTRLRVWVRQGWIRPAVKATPGFSEADMARAALIRDLEDKLGFDEDLKAFAEEWRGKHRYDPRRKHREQA